jgi:hypothetical protein
MNAPAARIVRNPPDGRNTSNTISAQPSAISRIDQTNGSSVFITISGTGETFHQGLYPPRPLGR